VTSILSGMKKLKLLQLEKDLHVESNHQSVKKDILRELQILAINASSVRMVPNQTRLEPDVLSQS